MISSQSASHLWLLNSLLFSCQISMMITQDYVYWILVGWMHGCLMDGFWLSALTRNVKKNNKSIKWGPRNHFILLLSNIIFFQYTHIRSTAQTPHCSFLSSWCHSLFYFSVILQGAQFIVCMVACVFLCEGLYINWNYTSKYMLYVDRRSRSASARVTGGVQVITDLMNCYKFLIISWVHKYQVVKPCLPYSSKTAYLFLRSSLAGVLSGWEAGNNCPLEKYLII